MNKTEIERIAENIDHFDEVEVVENGWIARFSAYDSGIKERSSVLISASADTQEATRLLMSAANECNINIQEFKGA